jgi:hypothetical protein
MNGLLLVGLFFLLGAILNAKSFDANIIFLIVSIYLTPYFIYMKN